MKLRNKKTGEIGILGYLISKNIFVNDENGIQLGKYTSLAELNEEWDDYEEPKTAWFIDPQGDIQEWRDADCDDWTKEKEIGNYFETEEEAEKAVEKLKAWKRLKDEYDFKFTGWKRDEQYRGDFIISAQDWNTSDDKLLDLLFGGEK